MKTVKFTYFATAFNGTHIPYRCSEPSDQPGEYVKAELVSDLVKAAMNYHLRRPSAETTDNLLAAIEALGVPLDNWS